MSKVKSRKMVQTPVVKFTKKARTAEIQAFVALCLGVFDNDMGGDDKELVNLTGLCLSTIKRLRSGQATCMIRANTLMALGAAVDLKLDMTASGSVLRIID